VSYQQSVSLHKKLLALGVKTEFVTIEGGVHGKFTKEQNDQINTGILQFLEACKLPFSTKKIEFKDRKSKRLNSSHITNSYAVFCWKNTTT